MYADTTKRTNQLQDVLGQFKSLMTNQGSAAGSPIGYQLGDQGAHDADVEFKRKMQDFVLATMKGNPMGDSVMVPVDPNDPSKGMAYPGSETFGDMAKLLMTLTGAQKQQEVKNAGDLSVEKARQEGQDKTAGTIGQWQDYVEQTKQAGQNTQEQQRGDTAKAVQESANKGAADTAMVQGSNALQVAQQEGRNAGNVAEINASAGANKEAISALAQFLSAYAGSKRDATSVDANGKTISAEPDFTAAATTFLNMLHGEGQAQPAQKQTTPPGPAPAGYKWQYGYDKAGNIHWQQIKL